MSQNERILELLRGGPVTPLGALEVGCFRLAARVKDLRDQGYEIHSEMRTTDDGKRYAQYTLLKTTAA